MKKGLNEKVRVDCSIGWNDEHVEELDNYTSDLDNLMKDFQLKVVKDRNKLLCDACYATGDYDFSQYSFVYRHNTESSKFGVSIDVRYKGIPLKNYLMEKMKDGN